MFILDKTIFFGNGINCSSHKGVSWENLLKNLAEEYGVRNYELILEQKLYTLLYERIVMESYNSKSEMILKEKLAKLMETNEVPDIYSKLVDLNAKNYVTTNYEDLLIKSFEKRGFKEEEGNNSNEDIYSIRRNCIMKRDFSEYRIWHMHGRINRPKTIMLGLDHYSGYIAKIKAYLLGKYESDKIDENVINMKDKIKNGNNKPWDDLSWIELFFKTDVHIMGFGLAYSETDLWWLLNKRARMKKENPHLQNRIVFYGDADPCKEELLKSFEIEVVLKPKEQNWDDFNEETIQRIKQ